MALPRTSIFSYLRYDFSFCGAGFSLFSRSLLQDNSKHPSAKADKKCFIKNSFKIYLANLVYFNDLEGFIWVIYIMF